MVEQWRYSPDAKLPYRIADGSVANLVGPHAPSLVLVLEHGALPDDASPDWLLSFRWDAARSSFPANPTSRWNRRGDGSSYLRPAQLFAADMDDNGDDELVITTGDPERSILLVDWRNGRFQTSKTFLPDVASPGSRTFSVSLADINGDLRPDIIAVVDGDDPSLRIYINSRRGFLERTIANAGAGPLQPSAPSGDINGDGQEAVILIQPDGTLNVVTMTGPKVDVQSMASNLDNLRAVAIVNADSDTSSELIYLLEDGTISSNDPSLAIPDIDRGARDSIFTVGNLTVLPPTTARAGMLLYISNGSAGAEIIIAEVGEPLPEEIPVEPVTTGGESVGELVSTAEPGVSAPQETFTVPAEGSEVYFPKRPASTDPRALPPNRSPDHLIYAEEEFARDVIGDRIDQFAGFRFLTKAPDMVFNYQRQSIVWVPAQDQLGAWNVAYEVTYHLGFRPEQMVTDSVLTPDKEIVTGQLLIYVNDKPRITTRPTSTNLLAGHLFAYRIGVDDRNIDARIDYRLESGPPGMTIDPGGIVSWRTDAIHHDDYQVVIAISDGFDRDVQTFVLNVNAQLTITSSRPTSARVGEEFRYHVEVFQPGIEKDHIFDLLEAPPGMIISIDGTITWTPEEAQLDTQRFQVRVSDGAVEEVQQVALFVNASPRLTKMPPRVVTFLSGDTVRIAFEGTDENATDVLNWRLAQGPVGMTIDSSGNITWPSSYQDLDAKGYVVELSDGRDETVFRGVVFANSPVGISSLPPDTAIIGQEYRYAVQVRDENRGTVLPYRRPVVIRDVAHTAAFEVEIQDDKMAQELPRYLAQFRNTKNIYINKPQRPAGADPAQAARIDLKQAVKHLFIEEDRLIVVIQDPAQGMVDLEDVLWELFQGGRGIMPRYNAEPVALVNFNLNEFPDGMTVSHDGIITWSPTPNQAGSHSVRLMVSDGFTRAEQIFEIYANYPPIIISQPDTMATIGKRYVYQVNVDDKNSDAKLTYRLVKAPEGMKVDSRGFISWMPTVEQLNWHEFILEVSDGYAVDRQATTLFGNMLPRVISLPKPVALNSYEYNYRLVAEDLNRDEIRYHAVKLPRYSEFDERTGRFRWRPKGVQKGPNDVAFEIIDARGGVTLHEFQVHVFEDPSRRQFLFASWPLMLAFVGIIFVLGITVGG